MTPKPLQVWDGVDDQTSKLDMWSLFATVVWVLDIDGFQEKVKKGGQPLCPASKYMHTGTSARYHEDHMISYQAGIS